jgi:uncharacterized protein
VNGLRLKPGNLSAPAQWLLLGILSASLAAFLHWAGLPAAYFLGPMAAAVAAGINGATVRVPRSVFLCAQGIMGCFIARAMTPAIVSSFLKEWPIILASVASIMAVASALGWSMSRSRLFPPATTIWGSWPGGAAAMIVMAAEFGADARLVAFMQYFRVLCVAGLASVAGAIWARTPATPLAEASLFGPINSHALAVTMLIAAAGIIIGRALKFPSGPMIATLFLAAFLHLGRGVDIELPRALLIATYAFLGWNVGLNFTPAILNRAIQAFSKVLLNAVLLITFCAALAYILTRALGIDGLTAFLATSPGGLDSVAIIAASSDVNLPFVMAFQTVRFLLIVIAGPPLARFLSRRV